MPVKEGSSPKSAGKITAEQRWKNILANLDPAVHSLLKRDDPAVDGMWHNFQMESPADVALSEPSRPYGYYYIQLSSLSAHARTFVTMKEMMESLLTVMKDSEECFILPFVGRPLRVKANDIKIFVESLDKKVPTASVYEGIDMNQEYEDSVFDDAEYLVTPQRCIGNAPLRTSTAMVHRRKKQ